MNPISFNKLLLRAVAALCVLAVLELASCSNAGKTRIGVSQCSTDDWRQKMNRELMLELSQHSDVTMEILSADDDNLRQIQDIRHFINEGVDVLIVSPREAEAITPVISEARAKGIKVVVFDRETTGHDYDLFYGADNALIGRNAGIYIRKYLTPAHTEQSPLEVVEIRGLDGSSPADGRSAGFREEISGNPRIRMTGSAACDWTFERAKVMADSMLRLYPNTGVVYAHNDRMALAARAAADDLGLHNIRIVGIDGAPEIGLEGVKNGKLDATLLYPTDGAEILLAALSLYKGEKMPERITATSAMVIDNQNVDLQLLSAQSLSHAMDNIGNLNQRVAAYAESRKAMRSMLWAGLVMLVLAALAVFLLLRLYWTRKRTQEIVEGQNETLREQRDSLENLNKQLNEATASKINFFTNVSHDLRTPLTLISAPLDALADSPGFNENQRGLIQLAQKNVKILRRLINQILDFQKYDQGKLQLDLSPVNITAAVKEWASTFTAAARSKSIKLKVTAHPDEPCIVAVDRGKMERIFFNLMSNAFKFTPSNGHIDIRLETSADEVVLEIHDDGRGIPAGSIPHLFEQFYQVRGGNSGGSGIGLAVVKNFVEMHGGTIVAESGPEGGATFIMRMPKRQPETVAEAATDMAAARNLPGYTACKEPSADSRDVHREVAEVEIAVPDSHPGETSEDAPVVLVIDDNPDIRALLKVLLGSEYTVVTAPDGEAGIRLASKYVPDCVVSDVMMPGLDGLEVTRRLKSETVTSHIPVILLTACGLDEQRVEGYDSGADGYIAKPFNDKVLLSKVRSVIANRRLLKAKPGASVPVPDVPAKRKEGAKASKLPRSTSADPLSEIDSQFYRDFVETVEKEMSNSELTVEELAGKAGMSRVQFYRKLKALTNFSPVDLLRLMRLRRAKELLVSNADLNVSEVGYMVGFSSPSYFAKCYRTQFGELPSETQQRTSRLQ